MKMSFAKFSIALLGLSMIACAPKPKLKAIKVTKTSVESTVTTISTGTVEAKHQANLAFGQSGRIARVWIKVGEQVRQGQLLAELENIDAKITFREAEKEAARSEKLFREQLISAQALGNAQKNLEVAKVNLDRTQIVAPFAGLVTELNMEVGELAPTTAAVGKTMLRLIDMEPRVVTGDIDELDLPKVAAGKKARIKVNAIRKEAFDAEVKRVVPFVSTTKDQDRTSKVELAVSDPKTLLTVGASADIEIIVDAKTDVLAVPSRVVSGSIDKRLAFVFRDGVLNQTPIKLGVGNYDRTEVVSGLNVGDVVVYPADDLELKDQMKVEVEMVAWP